MAGRRRIERTRDGAVRLRLPADERALLRGLPTQLRSLLREAPDDPTLQRLFPPAYEDADSESEYRRLMGDELLHGRVRALDVFEETLDQERLTTEEAQSWLTALNDLRLVLGTRLDVRDDTLLEGVDPNDPSAPYVAVYAYLSWLQEQLVDALAVDL